MAGLGYLEIDPLAGRVTKAGTRSARSDAALRIQSSEDAWRDDSGRRRHYSERGG